jgi:hypothetical protein
MHFVLFVEKSFIVRQAQHERRKIAALSKAVIPAKAGTQTGQHT